MRAYSLDLRVRVLAACDEGFTTSEVASDFGVSTAWVRRLKQRRRETGEIGPRQQERRGPPLKLAAVTDELMRLVEDQPDATETELAERLSVEVSQPTVHRMLHRLGYSFKKRLSEPKSKTVQTLQPNA